MIKCLTPDLQVHSIFDIDLNELLEIKRTTLLFDLDNTLTAWNSRIISSPVREWFSRIHSLGFRCVIVSNNHKERMESIAKLLNISYVERAHKPLKTGYLKALEIMQVYPENSVMIGDQIFTDVFGAKRVGLYTILVDPVHNTEFWGTKISRFFEYMVMHRRPVKKNVKNYR